jgi:hypothetical protein
MNGGSLDDPFARRRQRGKTGHAGPPRFLNRLEQHVRSGSTDSATQLPGALGRRDRWPVLPERLPTELNESLSGDGIFHAEVGDAGKLNKDGVASTHVTGRLART